MPAEDIRIGQPQLEGSKFHVFQFHQGRNIIRAQLGNGADGRLRLANQHASVHALVVVNDIAQFLATAFFVDITAQLRDAVKFTQHQTLAVNSNFPAQRE